MAISDVKRDQLLMRLQSYGNCVVAFSGGVDSAVVAKAAFLALADRSVAVTGISDSVAASERELARQIADQIGIRHVELATHEFENPAYTQNAPDRCFHCKTELYSQLHEFAQREGFTILANGANLDDLGDYRPGMSAAQDYEIRSPLAATGFRKQDVRDLALAWDLPVWNKPATPCLSSRVAYGQEVTPERLAMIDKVEQFLRNQGLATVRVRFHEGDLARLEVPLEAISTLVTEPFRTRLVEVVRRAGFRMVTVDLEGFRSGSLNQLIQLDVNSATSFGEKLK